MDTKSGLTSCEECGCFYVPRPPYSSNELCETCLKLKELRERDKV